MTTEAARRVSESVASARSVAPRRLRLCVSCGQRRSLFRYRGIVKADAHHPLCFRCYRSLTDSVRLQSRRRSIPAA